MSAFISVTEKGEEMENLRFSDNIAFMPIWIKVTKPWYGRFARLADQKRFQSIDFFMHKLFWMNECF